MKSIVLPAGTEHVLFGDLAHLIADALWPDAGANDDRMTYACAHMNLEGELARAVKSGALPVKDPLTLGPHTFPIGAALKRALVTVDDLREFVAGRSLSVLFQFTINEDGGSTTFSATQEEYDAMAAGKQAQRDERHKRGHYSMYEAAEVLDAANSIGGAEAFLKKWMRPAVESGALVLLDPIDRGPVTGRLCRPYDDWVTPKAINEWLAGVPFPYRWPVAATATQAPPVVAVGALVETDKTGPGWNLKTSIKRAPGYRWPLYLFLKAAHIAGQPCPKPRDVLEAWTLKPPPDVQAMPDGVKYNDGLGNSKEADLKAIQQAIKNLLN